MYRYGFLTRCWLRLQRVLWSGAAVLVSSVTGVVIGALLHYRGELDLVMSGWLAVLFVSLVTRHLGEGMTAHIPDPDTPLVDEWVDA